MERIIDLGRYTDRYIAFIIKILRRVGFFVDPLEDEGLYKVWSLEETETKNKFLDDMEYFEMI